MNPVAIVTGGTRGIGRAIVEALLARDFDVFFTYQHSTELAQQIEAQHGARVRGFQVDGGDWQAVRTFAENVTATRAVEVLVNNAGVNEDQLFVSSELERYWQAVHFNLGAVMAFCHAFAQPMMQRRRGQIINLSSLAAVKAKVGNGAYGVSKAAIERFTQTLALEMARFNVRVNAVAPGFVRSDLLTRYLAGRDSTAFYRSLPLRQVLEPEDVARVVALFACGELSATGSVLALGNGENING
ncbi:SDR family NAD(P)-dependent oxidoreductase [Paraburkholderia bonniea]|uniref:SDR family NAD(P)-dependent oxidoreductase n=1 Tax=Paraburkholderia bonniea TaxID=2152891 RepID=UPI002573C66D|nr:SDR family NAD(P)-dependent oxidoreductase [Paraburkholderia bonniea]WJF91522.1 SDR family NAD(P)-dependent oxidoreductase [Paraburkholderia bonniea]WJF94841.1 SDR family NAD(P)-dependent oxidoreductase [Paraburkholderia bonniea]